MSAKKQYVSSLSEPRQIQEKAQDYSGFGLKSQTPARESAQLSRPPARAAGCRRARRPKGACAHPQDLSGWCSLVNWGPPSEDQVPKEHHEGRRPTPEAVDQA